MDIQKEYKLYQVELGSFIVPARVIVMDNPEDIEGELVIFAKDRSIITKAQYEDFVLSAFIANIASIMYFTMHKNVDPKIFNDVRSELLSIAYEANPMLKPENLIVDMFGVLKVATKDKDVSGTPLTELESWNTESDSIVLNPKYIAQLTDTSEPEVPPMPDEDLSNKVKENSQFNATMREAIEYVNKLECLYKKVWWERIVSYITIKKFDEATSKEVLKAGSYSDFETYEVLMVTVLILNVEDVFSFVEAQGLLNKLTPKQIIHELYELCIKVNPYLDYSKLDKKQNRVGAKPKPKQKKSTVTIDDISLEQITLLEPALKKRVIGQDEAISSVVQAVKRAKVGIKAPEKPIGTFLFTGSTGVGKTYLAKNLHECLMGKNGAFIRIDCSEYSADHEYSKLIGSPPGYVMSEEGGQLTNKLIDNPFAVVLFDEIEKASPKVHQLLLQIMDDGVITDNKGTTVSFKDTIIIMTSNIGVDDIKAIKSRIGFGDVNVVNKERKGKALTDAVKDTFKPEFVNRIDNIIHFNDIDTDACRTIIDLELKYVRDLLATKRIVVDFSSGVKNLILKEGYSEEYGAREIKRTIETLISNEMADYLISLSKLTDLVVSVKVKRGKIVFYGTDLKTVMEKLPEVTCKKVQLV